MCFTYRSTPYTFTTFRTCVSDDDNVAGVHDIRPADGPHSQPVTAGVHHLTDGGHVQTGLHAESAEDTVSYTLGKTCVVISICQKLSSYTLKDIF